MSSSIKDLPAALRAIWLSNDLPEEFLTHLKLIGNPDQVVPSSFRIGLAAQISIGLAGLSAAYLHFLRTGMEQDVTVDARHAELSFHSEAWYTIDDALPSGGMWDNIAGLYQTLDGGWVRIHTNFPHHRSGVLSILGITESSDHLATQTEVALAIRQWNAQKLEDDCKTWNALSSTPVMEVCNIGQEKARKRRQLGESGSERPLGGVRVLDLSRVLAGPVAGRTLAAHGAQVLLVTSPNLPSLPPLDMETSLGKRTTQIDLTSLSGHNRLEELIKGADVFLQAYRPEGIASQGFGIADVVRMKATEENISANSEAVVYASLRAWGWDGPWAGRRGFDSLVQTATGFNVDEGAVYQAYLKSKGQVECEWAPRPLPMQALDHAAGYFLAFGINVALVRIITGGGSHEVRVSLAAVGKWIRSLGRLSPEDAFGTNIPSFPNRWPLQEEINKLGVNWAERRGNDKISRKPRRKITALRHAALIEATPVREGVMRGE